MIGPGRGVALFPGGESWIGDALRLVISPAPGRLLTYMGIAVANPHRHPCTRVMDVAGLGSVDRCAVSVREQQAAPLQAIMGSVPATGVGRAESRNDRLRYAGKRLLVFIPSV
jgi:hypothetical protein